MRIPSIYSVCCNAPVHLDLVAYDLLADTVAIRCGNCREEVAGMGMDHADIEIRRAVRAARWRRNLYCLMLSLRIVPRRFTPFIRVDTSA
jgi:hypothetical protein